MTSSYDAALVDVAMIEDHRLLTLARGVRLLHLETLVWCKAHLTDGFIPAQALNRLTDEPEPHEAAKELRRVGMWDMTDAGWKIADFLDTQMSAERVKAKRLAARERYDLWQTTPKRVGNAAANFEKRQQAREAKRKGTDLPLRTWSALSDLFRKGNTDATPIVLGKVSDDPASGAMQAATGIGGPMMIEVKPKTLDASPKGLLAYFAAKDIELSRGRRDTSRLVTRSRFEISDYDWTLLRRVEPLLVAELGGPKVLCTECSEPAVLPMKPQAWACAEHAQ